MSKIEKINIKKDIVNKIINGANIYKNYLLGKTFMFVYDDRYVEISFRKQDFAHLCGVNKTISSKDFYKDAIKGKLKESQIYFNDRHPLSLCIRKTNEIGNIHRCIYEEGFVLEDIKTTTTVFKLGFTDLNFTLCFDYDFDDKGNKKSDYLIVKSLRDEDCFKKATNVYEIDFILQKNNNDKLYDIITYKDNKKDITNMNSSILKLISPALLK